MSEEGGMLPRLKEAGREGGIWEAVEDGFNSEGLWILKSDEYDEIVYPTGPETSFIVVSKSNKFFILNIPFDHNDTISCIDLWNEILSSHS